MTSGEAHPETRRMMETAIRRLNVLEYVILGVAMALAFSRRGARGVVSREFDRRTVQADMGPFVAPLLRCARLGSAQAGAPG